MIDYTGLAALQIRLNGIKQELPKRLEALQKKNCWIEAERMQREGEMLLKLLAKEINDLRARGG